MDRKEAAKIMMILQANYPDSFRDMSDQAIQARVRLWELVFAQDAHEAVQAAVMAHIATDTNRFMPPCGVIKESLLNLQRPNEMTEDEAWQLVRAAIRESTYKAPKEFKKLPDICKKIVGDYWQLRTWSLLEGANALSVVESNFKKEYRVQIKRERARMALPEPVLKYINAAVESMALPAGERRIKENGHGKQQDIHEVPQLR